MHHPFTAPHVDDLEHGRSIADSRALAYDMVYNGSEIGGGSLHDSPTPHRTQEFLCNGFEQCLGFAIDVMTYSVPLERVSWALHHGNMLEAA